MRIPIFAGSLLLAIAACDQNSSTVPRTTDSNSPSAVLVGAGDIASCDSGGDEGTAALLDTIPGVVFTLGDNVYPTGTLDQFRRCYEPTWGRHRSRTRPAPGNHEYLTAGAAGYFDYFGEAAGPRGLGYYSYELAGWHIIVLNSEIPTGPDAVQTSWLRAELLRSPTRCTLAYWHRPRFSSGPHGGDARLQAWWEPLYEANAEIVMSGHDHLYERFAPQTPAGVADPQRGIRQFVAGLGGNSSYPVKQVAVNSEVRHTGTPGVLKLTLYPRGYEWRYLSARGDFTDSGRGTCH